MKTEKNVSKEGAKISKKHSAGKRDSNFKSPLN